MLSVVPDSGTSTTADQYASGVECDTDAADVKGEYLSQDFSSDDSIEVNLLVRLKG